ncbi:Afadin and alpha-actinin-binding-domain-containing protein [Spinellus fusiger]|nr:Afadin and alpha-actinin-binding-domain-containing protein [Spinellus fusiger]
MDTTHDMSFELESFESPLSPSQFQLNDLNPMDMRAFCTPNNIDSCSNHVNIQLTAQGYPVPLVFNSVTVEDTCRMINCIHALLSDKKSQEEMIFELNKSILDKKRAYESLSLKFEQQKKATEKEKKEKEHLALKIESMTMTIKTEKDHHRSIKDELTRAKNNLQYIKAQYSHETRRHEQEHAKTRDRLMKLMKNMSRPVMTISQPLVAIKPSSPDILTQVTHFAQYWFILVWIGKGTVWRSYG